MAITTGQQKKVIYQDQTFSYHASDKNLIYNANSLQLLLLSMLLTHMYYGLYYTRRRSIATNKSVYWYYNIHS